MNIVNGNTHLLRREYCQWKHPLTETHLCKPLRFGHSHRLTTGSHLSTLLPKLMQYMLYCAIKHKVFIVLMSAYRFVERSGGHCCGGIFLEQLDVGLLGPRTNPHSRCVQNKAHGVSTRYVVVSMDISFWINTVFTQNWKVCNCRHLHIRTKRTNSHTSLSTSIH